MSRIIVHGVHRSGTSLTASLLAGAGCWYAEKRFKMSAQKDNPNGFWERTDVVNLNDEALASENLSWFTLKPEVSKEMIARLDHGFGDQVVAVAKRLEGHKRWFLKDPRLSITWPLWEKYLPATHHIVVHRHPLFVADSLNRRNGISIDHGLIFWYHQTRMIARALSGADNVYSLEFGDDELCHEAMVDVVNKVVPSEEGMPAFSKNTFDTIFDPSLISKDLNSDRFAKEYSLIYQAWNCAKNGELELLTDMPEIPVSQLSWYGLDSKYALTESFTKSTRDVAQYQDEVNRYSKKLVKKIRQTEDLNNSVEKLTQDVEISKNLNINNLKKEVEGLEGIVRGLEQKIQGLEEEVVNSGAELKAKHDIIDELNLRLLKISSELKKHMLLARYIAPAAMSKIFMKLGLGSNRFSLHSAFDIAKFGHSSSDLDRVLPNVSNRLLLLKAMVRNPVSFMRRMTLKRVHKGFNMLIGRVEADIGVKQALLQYSSTDLPLSNGLSIFDPENNAAWVNVPIEFEKQKAPKVSIVIPVYNNYLTTLACLHSIVAHTSQIQCSYEVIIADDCSNDETSKIERVVKGIRVIRGENNLGFLKNCNYAIPHSRGNYIVLLNNDTNVQPGWLDELLYPLESDPNIGVTGPKFVYPDGRLQEAGGIIFSDASGWNYGRFDQPDKPEYSFSRDVDYVSGACLVFRKSLWGQIGGFDEVFTPAYYEDTDFCFEARKRGLVVRFIASSVVVHYEGVSHGSNEDSGVKKYQVVNCKKFAKKWRKALNEQHYAGPDELFSARVHGRAKKTLLFIDHYVPFYDKDAGSKVAQRYIELLVEEGVRVIFLGDNFYPHQPYTKELQQLGVEVLFGEHYKNNWFEWLEENSKSIDAIYLNRPHISENYIDRIKSLEHVPFLAYHGADLHYVRVGRQEELGVADGEGRSSEEWRKVEYDLMRKCDISLWLSELEVDTVNREDPSINVAYKPMYWFDESTLRVDRNIEPNRNLLFVGGFGHPPNLDGLKWFLDEIYPLVLKRHPDTTLTVIGSNCPDEVTALASDNVKILGFVSEQELIDAYDHARLSIVPLRYGAGVKGKVIESMQYGVPVITTNVGSEGLPGEPKSYLSVADEPQLFASEIIQMLEHDELCQQKITESDKALLEYFSKESAIQAINKMIGVPAPATQE